MIIDPKTIDVDFEFDGMVDDATPDSLLCAGAKEFPDEYLIDRSEWEDRIRELDAANATAEDFSVRFTHQGGSHECVFHMRTQLAEICYNQQTGGRYPVRFSPLAGYTVATNGRQYGGSMVMDSLQLGIEDGCLPEYDGQEWLGGDNGQDERFRHCLHLTSGRSEDHWRTSGWVKPRDLPDGWENTARHFRFRESFAIRYPEQHISALLRGRGVGNGRSGHSIPHVRAVIDPDVSSRRNIIDRILSRYKDSYNRFGHDTWRKLGGGYVVWSMTGPDDPLRPAGDDMREVA